jgi:hypothetical protein
VRPLRRQRLAGGITTELSGAPSAGCSPSPSVDQGSETSTACTPASPRALFAPICAPGTDVGSGRHWRCPRPFSETDSSSIPARLSDHDGSHGGHGAGSLTATVTATARGHGQPELDSVTVRWPRRLGSLKGDHDCRRGPAAAAAASGPVVVCIPQPVTPVGPGGLSE